MGLAVVTGASSGIGESYARALARRGDDLVVVGRRADRLSALAGSLHGEFGSAVEARAVDLADRAALTVLADELSALPVDTLVNNAGLAHYMPFADLPADAAIELLDVNVTAPMLLTKAVLPGMRQRGRGAIVNVASLLAFSAAADRPQMPARAVYAATKSFLLTHTRLLAAELADSGVTAQVVCPGVVATEFHSRQGIDLSAQPRMTADDLVAAALADLDAGIVVSVPGLDDLQALADVDAAELRILSVASSVATAARYRA